jgi:hypothetical protein
MRVHGEDAAVPSREVTSSPATVTTAGTATDVASIDATRGILRRVCTRLLDRSPRLPGARPTPD